MIILHNFFQMGNVAVGISHFFINQHKEVIMAKFNEKKEKTARVENYMGAPAFVDNPQFALVNILLTSFVQDKYYESEADEVKRLIGYLDQVDPLFAAKAAVYARNEFGMRSVSHIMASALAKKASGTSWGRKFYNAIVRRPDDMLEIVAHYFGTGNKRLSSAMQDGLRMAFDKFDGYQLAKYRGEKRGVSLIDMVRLVHPKATDRNAEALKQLVDGTLRNTKTWEAKISKAGQDAKDEDEKLELKGAAWAELIESGKIGQFALLRNLRNIIKDAPGSVTRACELLTTESRNRKSLILPFRFLTAYGEIETAMKEVKRGAFESEKKAYNDVLAALEVAINQSIANLPELPGKTVILSDNSGSMHGDGGGGSAVSANSKTTSADIANLFATMYWMKSTDTVVGLFGDRLVYPDMDRKKGLFENYKIVATAGKTCGGGTETGIFNMFERLIKNKEKVDRIVVFSDCQIGTGCAWYDTGHRKGNDFNALHEEYRKIHRDFNFYSVNLRAYGTTVFGPGVIKLGGWSEKIFDLMRMYEQDKNALINTINNIQF